MQIKTHWRILLSLVAMCACGTVSAHHVEVSGPITSGSQGGPFAAPGVDVATLGYVVEEFFLTGKASAYRTVNGSKQSADGRWLTEREPKTKPYRTRILVVRPADNRDFNGTVIVHWQNVTAGYELGTVTDGEYLRGYAWVGVSAQSVGVNGFPGPNAAGLKQWDAERYGSLNHPGDAYSFDIFSQAGAVVEPNRMKRNNDPMGGLTVRHLVAAGASQSASRLRTYINGVHSDAQIFDGYIPYIDFASAINFAADKRGERGRRSTQIRSDLDVPVFVVNSETETQAYCGARQPDTDRFRFWEAAGTSHVSVPRATAANAPGLNS
ncbi:MAG: alpha/beta hydrolase domain-containing protein, partial [Gammaproteobacteria bacterium]|nr:alpha/beta hydrolase domain-containing protein [Gammaproteobacteria bacterium]